MSLLEEYELIAQAKTDPEAFALLYQRYVNRIYNYHYRHTSHQVEAEDLTSRTFYRALRSLHRYRETGASFQAWLFRIAHNLVANWYRDQSRKETVTIDDDNPPLLYSRLKNPEASALDSETYRTLVSVIDSLPEDRKTLILLKFVEELTNAEIAAVLGKTEGAVKALYHRTLISLRKMVPEDVWNEEAIQD
jgi:RNA polymerase sigma-70 factor (ECF subfamily)